jgi:hypothetical protein
LALACILNLLVQHLHHLLQPGVWIHIRLYSSARPTTADAERLLSATSAYIGCFTK